MTGEDVHTPILPGTLSVSSEDRVCVDRAVTATIAQSFDSLIGYVSP